MCPYWKVTLVATPLGLTLAAASAEVAVTEPGASGVSDGGALAVVKVASVPSPVPLGFVAVTR